MTTFFKICYTLKKMHPPHKHIVNIFNILYCNFYWSHGWWFQYLVYICILVSECVCVLSIANAHNFPFLIITHTHTQTRRQQPRDYVHGKQVFFLHIFRLSLWRTKCSSNENLLLLLLLYYHIIYIRGWPFDCGSKSHTPK